MRPDHRSLWIVNQYATHPERGSACRHFRIGRELVKRGIAVTIVAASSHHFHRKPPERVGLSHPEIVDGVRFLWLKTRAHRQNDRLGRVASWFRFAARTAVLPVGDLPPTTILQSSPSLVPFLGAAALARRTGARLVFEFRDVWPMTLTTLGRYRESHPLVRLHAAIERSAIRRSDRVVSTLERGAQRLAELGADPRRFLWLPNGCDPDLYADMPQPDAALPRARPHDALMAYVGTVGLANALDIVLDAADRLRDAPVSLLIVGSGSERARLADRAKAMGLDNLFFEDAVASADVPALLAQVDGLLIAWHDEAIYRYGVSPNKLPEYLASARPVVQAYSGQGDLVRRFDAGRTVPSGDGTAFAEAIRDLAGGPASERRRLGENGRRAAFDHLSFPAIAERLDGIVV